MASEAAADAGDPSPSLSPETLDHLTLQKRALDDILHQRPVPAILNSLAEAVEAFVHGRCAAWVTLLEPISGCLRTSSAPKLPAAFQPDLSGLTSKGVLATALAARRELIAVDLVAVPNWEDLARVPLTLGWPAGWWRPILGTHGVPLGSFGVYFLRQRGPTAPEREFLGVIARTAALAIERDLPSPSPPGIQST